jgi:hypothetical protein
MLDVEQFFSASQPISHRQHTLYYYTGGSVISSAIACTSHGTRCLTHSLINLAVHWPSRLVAGLSPRRPGLDPRSVHVRFVIGRVALWQVLLRVLCFDSVSIIAISVLCLSSSACCWYQKDRLAKHGNLSKNKKQCSFLNRGALDRKLLPPF